MPDAGRPPVGRSAAAGESVPQERALSVPARNYLTIVETLKANKGAEAKQIQAMFGGDKKLMDSFLATCFNLLQSAPDILADCTPMSLVQCVKDAASLGLVPLTDEAAIVPYGQKSGDKVAKLMPMWRGYVKRIRNSRQVVDLDVQIVYENDLFEIELGTHPSIKHVPKQYMPGEEDGRGDYRGCYAWALMPSGLYIIEWMTADDIEYIRQTFGNKPKSDKPGPWETSWPEMARKTLIRRLAKRLPASAVDQLLALDKANDEAADRLEAVAAKVDDGLEEVRQLALAAVGQLPAGDPRPNTNEEPTEPAKQDEPQPPEQPDDGGSPVVAEGKPKAGGPGAAAVPEPDPNVAAAMALSAEQEQLRLQRTRR